MFSSFRYKLFIAFCDELKLEIKEKYPDLTEQEQQAYFQLLMEKLLQSPLDSLGKVSELRDNI